MTRRPRATVALQRLAVRSGEALRPLWTLLYRAVAHGGAALLTWRERGASAYVRGGVEGSDFVPGLSDVDLTIVLPQDAEGPGVAARRVRRRRDRLRRALPFLALVLDWPSVYEGPELRELVRGSTYSHGLEATDRPATARAGYLGERASLDRILLLERPGLYGATTDWHLLRGPRFDPREPPRDRDLRRGAAWLELVFWWRQLFLACAAPASPRISDLCVKAIAETARIWLWLADGERVEGRAAALRLAIERLPEEGEALRSTLELQRELPRSPRPPLKRTLPALVRISARIAALVDADAEAAGSTGVRLGGGEPAELALPDGGWHPPPGLDGAPTGEPRPLADWRALVCPRAPDDAFMLLDSDLTNPAVLAAAASIGEGPYPTLRADGLIVRPGATYPRTRLRAIQCRATDPVSFALAEGDRVARFPKLGGYSAADAARRAIAEHRAWLQTPSGNAAGCPRGRGRDLGLLLTAARAALFSESIAAGEPVLALTVAEAGRALGERSSSARAVAEEAVGRYREFARSRQEPPSESVSAMRALVRGLEPYASG